MNDFISPFIELRNQKGVPISLRADQVSLVRGYPGDRICSIFMMGDPVPVEVVGTKDEVMQIIVNKLKARRYE